jgi:diaminohydroxyphosphoribosylaminopyrimidine deaminase / 5-amino-6-(5-phosphoribosylamino)uracil reductase
MTSAVATEQDRLHLRRALELAEGGRGRVSPNPLVGAVLVKDGEVIGEGFHERFGAPHAEVAALDDCRRHGADPTGATLYATLEPCAHHGKQPPCAEAIVAAGVRRVVIASDDPSEKASGRGPGVLRDEGIEVAIADGPEATAARLLNQAFRKHARTGIPHVALKLAQSLDGRVATTTGESKWISGESSRELVHRWRAEADAVAVGIGTALADDPLLTARTPEAENQPLRVIFDSSARLPLDSALVQSLREAPLLLVAAPDAPRERIDALRGAGAEVIVVDGDPAARVRSALADLGRRAITSMLIEGGPGLAGAFLDAGEVDELRVFIAPLVLGGQGARSPIDGEGAPRVGEGRRALHMDADRLGEDLLVRARLREW